MQPQRPRRSAGSSWRNKNSSNSSRNRNNSRAKRSNSRVKRSSNSSRKSSNSRLKSSSNSCSRNSNSNSSSRVAPPSAAIAPWCVCPPYGDAARSATSKLHVSNPNRSQSISFVICRQQQSPVSVGGRSSPRSWQRFPPSATRKVPASCCANVSTYTTRRTHHSKGSSNNGH